MGKCCLSRSLWNKVSYVCVCCLLQPHRENETLILSHVGAAFMGLSHFHVRLVLPPPPPLLGLSLLPSLLPPSVVAHVGTAPIGGDTSMRLCVHRVAPSVRPSVPLTQRHFPSFVSSALLGDASSTVFAPLLGSGQDEAVRFPIFRTQQSKRKDKPKSGEHLKY